MDDCCCSTVSGTGRGEFPQTLNFENRVLNEYWFSALQWLPPKHTDNVQNFCELLPSTADGKPLTTLAPSVYSIAIRTGTISNGGTSARVFITLIGEKWESGEFCFQNANGREFLTGSQTVYQVGAIGLGQLTKIRIRHDNSGISPNWYLEYVFIHEVTSDNGRDYLFPCHQWLPITVNGVVQLEGEILMAPLSKSYLSQMGISHIDMEIPINKTKHDVEWQNTKQNQPEYGSHSKIDQLTYAIYIKTGRQADAGTSSNAYIKLSGEKGHTAKIPLKKALNKQGELKKKIFGKGDKDIFLIRAPDIGLLKGIRLGHDKSGHAPLWYVENVRVKSKESNTLLEFPCYQWIGESDNQHDVYVDLSTSLPELQQPKKFYQFKIFSSKIEGFGPNAVAVAKLIGPEGRKTDKFELKNILQHAGIEILFIELKDIGESLERLYLEIKNGQPGYIWQLDRVEIRPITAKSHEEKVYIFVCNQTLTSANKQRFVFFAEKETRNNLASTLNPKLSYEVAVTTGNFIDAGTTANVYIKLIDTEMHEVERCLLPPENEDAQFQPGHTDIFILKDVSLKEICKIQLRHDNTGASPLWFVEKVIIREIIMNTPRQGAYIFKCNRWISKDGEEFFNEYYPPSINSSIISHSPENTPTLMVDKFPKQPQEQIKTMASPSGVSISNSSIPLCEPQLVSLPPLPKKNYDFHTLPFDKITETSQISLRRESDSETTLPYPSVPVPPEDEEATSLEPTGETLPHQRVDKKDIRNTYYQIKKTNLKDYLEDQQTEDRNCYHQLHLWLNGYVPDNIVKTASLQVSGNNGLFEKAVIYRCEWSNHSRLLVLKFSVSEDFGQLSLLKIGFQQLLPPNDQLDWTIACATLQGEDNALSSQLYFTGWYSEGLEKGVHRWTELTFIPPHKPSVSAYKVRIKTSEMPEAKTDANVYIRLTGEALESNDILLDKSETNSRPFQTGQIDQFTLTHLPILGALTGCRLWHDNRMQSAAWLCEWIYVLEILPEESHLSPQGWYFPCNRWLQGDGRARVVPIDLIPLDTTAAPKLALMEPHHGFQELEDTRDESEQKEKNEYIIQVETSSSNEAGTDHLGWIIIKGRNSTSSIIRLTNPDGQQVLQSGHTDTFRLRCENLGGIQQIYVGLYDPNEIVEDLAELKYVNLQLNRCNQWNCKRITLTDIQNGEVYIFNINQWILASSEIDKRIGVSSRPAELRFIGPRNIREIKGDEGPVVVYKISVETGDCANAGTTANVYITLYGYQENVNSGTQQLSRWSNQTFTRGQNDEFYISCVKLGDVKQIQIEHDNSGNSPDWFIEQIVVEDTNSGKKWIFLCHDWVSLTKGSLSLCQRLTIS